MRLEALSQKLIEANEGYRLQLDKEHLNFKDNLVKQFDELKSSQEKDYQAKEEKLKEREKALDNRLQELDDRNSKHARRQLRQELKKALANRAQEFTLTEKTNKKRIIIHSLFMSLMLLFGGAIIYSGLNLDQTLYTIVRLGWATAAFAATVIFYIRWNDQWFRQHADEEFKLKQLELDIDRASWVVEMALEWKEEKGTEIPQELIDRLTQRLFIDRDKPEAPKHPSEDLATALLSASTGLKLQVPGFGELVLNKKGLKDFRKTASESSES